MALAAYGFARATLDADVLVVTPDILESASWKALEQVGAKVDVRRGDADDPFRAVIRITRSGSSPVDVLVGRFAWQRDIVERATRVTLQDFELPVATAADLVLLKLFAGGPQDHVDAQRLLDGPIKNALVVEVDSRIHALPESCRRDWLRMKSA
jgi:hypothetical protein